MTSQLQTTRLDDETLKKEPEDVFDLLEKLGEGEESATDRAQAEKDKAGGLDTHARAHSV